MAEGAGLTGGVSGATKGAKLGGMIGSAVPGIGNAVGAAAGGALGGIAGMVGGLSKQNKSEQSQKIAMADPLEQSRMQELRQISKNISTGSDALTQNKLSEINKLGAQTQGAIAKVSGGDVGGTVQGLLQAQRGTQTGINQALSDRGQLPYYQGLAQQLSSRMADRKLQLGLLDRAQKTAEYAQARKNANLNMMGLLASGAQGISGLIGQGQAPDLGTPSATLPTSGGITTDTTHGLDQNVANVDPNQSMWANGGMEWQSPVVPSGTQSSAPIGQTDQTYGTGGNVNGITPDPYAYANEAALNAQKTANTIQPNYLNQGVMGLPGMNYMGQQVVGVPSVDQTLNEINN